MSGSLSSLASLSTVITKGTTPTTLGYAHSDSGIPFLRVQNIFGGQVNFEEDTLFIGSDTHAALKRSQIQGGDVLVTIAGTIGRTGVVPFQAPSMNCNQAVAIIRPTAKVERSYLRHWLESQDARGQMIGSTVTGTISNLSLSQLGELKVPLPPLKEQYRIAAILDQAETLRTNRRVALAQLDSLTQSIFLAMFGDPVVNPNGWPCHSLGDLIAEGPQNGLYKPSTDYGSGTPILRIDAFYDGVVTKLDTLKRVRLDANDVMLFGLQSEDIVINRVNSIEYLGKSALIPKLSEPTVFESNMMRFKVKLDQVDPGYVVHFLQTGYIKGQILSGSKNAVNQSSINQQDVKGFRINVPPLPLQQTFATRIQAIESLKTAHRAALAQLDALFASLQQRVFAGLL